MCAAASGACRECAQPGFGGPSENRFTAYDAICRGDLCGRPGYPQIYVNLANLTIFVRVTDLTFGGPAPALTLERFYNMDDTRPGPFGVGWSFNLGDSLTAEADGTLVLRRGSGRIDRFASASSGGFFAVTSTSDSLTRNGDRTYTLRRQGSGVARVFSEDGRLLAIQDAGSTRASLSYDATGRLAEVRYRGRRIQFSHDAGGRITSVTDSAGRIVSYSYTSEGRLASQVNADGQTVSYEYDDAGNLRKAGATAIDYGGEPGYWAVARVTAPDGASRSYETGSNATQIRVADGNGDATVYVSNAAGLLISATDANGGRVGYGYDSAGRRISVANGAGETSRLSYDAGGNLTAIVDAAANRWSAEYSTAGPFRVTDPNGNVWTFRYDAAGNLEAVGNPANGTVSADRTAAGNITTTDARGNKATYQYNADGLPASFTDALGAMWTYEYDGAARVSSRTDPGGAVVAASYDSSNRIAELTSGDAKLTFDRSGFTRDELNRLTGYQDSFGNQVSYAYDSAGRLSGITLPGGKTVSYEYDRAGRLSRVADWQGNFALYRYDAAGWPGSVSISGGPVTVYQYDTARRLRATVSTGPDGAPVAGYRYTLDANGNRTGVSALEPAGTQPAVAAQSYRFDAVGRPESRADGESYKYYARGSLSAIQGPRSISFDYDAFGRLQGLRGDVSTSYTYDAAGLRAARNVNGVERRFVYDLSSGQPRLVMESDDSNTPIAWYVWGLVPLWKVSADGSTYFYHFDGNGNVVAVSSTSAGVVNRYGYDPAGRLTFIEEGVDNPFRAGGEAGWIDDGNGLVFTGSAYRLPELRLMLPATADVSPPALNLLPGFRGAGACFLEGVGSCLFATGRRER
jgi:YD repeat-containing protein